MQGFFECLIVFGVLFLFLAFLFLLSLVLLLRGKRRKAAVVALVTLVLLMLMFVFSGWIVDHIVQPFWRWNNPHPPQYCLYHPEVKLGCPDN